MRTWLALLATIATPAHAQTGPTFAGPTSSWRGFDRVDFEVAGRRARVIVPPVRAPENPWIWRGIFVAAGPDAGAVEWSVDDGAPTRQELSTRWSQGLHLPWAYVLTAELPPGDHVLTLRVAAATTAKAKAATAVRIAYFLVNDAAQ